MFTLEAYILEPGESTTQRVGLVKSSCDYARLTPGLYRVAKDVGLYGSDAQDEVILARASFRVRQ